MEVKKSFIFQAVICSMFSLTQCTNQASLSNSAVSNEVAQASLEQRLKKTNEINLQLNSVRDALLPLESILTDVSNAVNTRVTLDGKPVDRLHDMIQKLREVLKESTQGLVQYRTDGSWVIERFDSTYAGSKLEIIGQRIEDYDQLKIAHIDLASTASSPLVTLKVYTDRINMFFDPKILDSLNSIFEIKLSNVKILSDQCSVQVHGKNVEFLCEPVEIQSQSIKVSVNSLKFNNKNGINADIKINVRNISNELLADLDFEARPGVRTSIQLRTQ